eukprot:scaffold198230_cov30-Tisochrysis_lutea.AAC.1
MEKARRNEKDKSEVGRGENSWRLLAGPPSQFSVPRPPFHHSVAERAQQGHALTMFVSADEEHIAHRASKRTPPGTMWDKTNINSTAHEHTTIMTS